MPNLARTSLHTPQSTLDDLQLDHWFCITCAQQVVKSMSEICCGSKKNQDLAR